MADGLEQLRDTLLVQCRSAEAATALDLAQNSGSGVVVTGRKDRRTVLTLAHLAHRRARSDARRL